MGVKTLRNTYDSIKNVLITDAEVENTLTGEKIETKAIWDTGATNTSITKRLAAAINLKKFSKAEIRGVHGTKEVPVFYAKVTLQNKSISLEIPITGCDELSNDGSVGLLIGMDIISKGDFCVSNYQGKTTMTFRTPSVECTDYAQEVTEANKYLRIYESRKKHGNEKCPCGSNKLFKNCHGKYFKE